eukprot:8516731-Lingulodinium_polyedra.AAC.1
MRWNKLWAPWRTWCCRPLNARPESAADLGACSQLSSNILALGLCRRGQVELVRIAAHRQGIACGQ